MNVFVRRYWIDGWYETHFLTAKQLHDQVMTDSTKSNYNWIASAPELVRITMQPDFPENYATDIKVAILNCFAALELMKEYPSHGTSRDNEAVYYCYNSLSGTNLQVITAKHKYLLAVIKAVIKYHFRLLEFNHYGPTYNAIRDEWENSKFQEYCSMQQIDFEKLRKELDDDFDKIMKTAEAEGRFKEDDEKNEEEMKEFWSSISSAWNV